MTQTPTPEGERIAKVLARAGIASRRDAEKLVFEGRITVNGETLASPGVRVTPRDDVRFDGERIRKAEPARLWRYHKPEGLVSTHKDPQCRPTVFERLPENMPRVVSVGRLDLNTEGLLLLTTDGGLSRLLELPSTGWRRRYRVRAYGRVSQAQLDSIKDGVTIDGIAYGPVAAVLDQVQGGNSWLTIGITEGKNREVRTICRHFDLVVNRLIRTSYGPFQLGSLPRGGVEEVPKLQMIEQLGRKNAASIGLV